MNHLPVESRPREKLLHRGAEALSDAELMAIVLRTGMVGKNVLTLAQELLDRFGGVSGLLNASASELKAIKGLGGPAKRALVLAVLALSRRALAEQLKAGPAFEDPQSVKQYVQLHLGHKPHEVFAVLFLNAQHRLLAMEKLFRGSLTQTSVYPREVVQRALHHQAAALILAHNHPSGHVQPSPADLQITQTLKAALALVDVRVLDHLIVAPGLAHSMAEQGQI